MVLTTSSIGLVIWLSISSGEAPGSRVVIVMVGRSTLGKMSTPSWRNEARPRTTSDATSIVVKTGRRTNDLEHGLAWIVRECHDTRGRALTAGRVGAGGACSWRVSSPAEPAPDVGDAASPPSPEAGR